MPRWPGCRSPERTRLFVRRPTEKEIREGIDGNAVVLEVGEERRCGFVQVYLPRSDVAEVVAELLAITGGGPV
jgi:hypothetical protein